MKVRLLALLLLLSTAYMPAETAAQSRSEPCGGEAPTSWYLRTVAPLLPDWQQRPDHPRPVAYPAHFLQGSIALDAFADVDLEQLVCWADNGDKLSALAAAVRLHDRARPRYSTGQPGLPIVEHYLRVAARDESPSGPCATPFCHGVPEAMFRLAYYRLTRDDEWRSLMERARDSGLTQARYELEGRSPPYPPD